MVLAFHGKEVAVDEIRTATGTDRDGTSALTLLQAAEWFGLRGRGVSLDVDQLECLEPASILHWEFNHFVVFEQVARDGVHIVDPRQGRRKVPLNEFRRAFTGVALVLEPGEGFVAEGQNPGLLRYQLRDVFRHSNVWAHTVGLTLLVQVFGLSVPLVLAALIDRVIPLGDQSLLSVLGIGVGCVVVFRGLSDLLRRHLLLHVQTYMDRRMTLRCLDHLVQLPYDFFQHRSPQDLMRRLESTAVVREIVASGILSSLVEAVVALFCLIVLFFLSSPIALVVIGVGLMQILAFWIPRKRLGDLGAQRLAVDSRSQRYLAQMIAGMESLKAAGAELRAAEHWSHYFIDAVNVSIHQARTIAVVEAVAGALRLAAPLLVLLVGGMAVLDGSLTVGTMLGLSLIATSILGPVGNLIASASQIPLLSSQLERLEEILQAPIEQDRDQAGLAPRLSGRIGLAEVSFAYGPSAPLVLRGVSFEIHPGQLVAVVGPSGSGKSTLVRLIAGLYRPLSGVIAYDGIDLVNLDIHSARRQLGYVPQYPFLFGQSIRANIALADPTASLEEVVQAARLAQIHDEIAGMPMGYETLLLDGGASLSGGQRQRIALARALVRCPAVLLLDEATSALDAVTESAVHDALRSLRTTRIVVAHRLSTVKDADLVLMIDKGSLVECGTHEDLLSRRGRYAELVAAQIPGTGPT